jgi:putative transposase
VSERRVCQLVGQHRSTNRQQPDPGVFERRLIKRLHELASEHPQEGYKTTWRRLRFEGWRVNHKRIERLWRQDGLKQPERQASGKHAEGAVENAMWKRRAERPDHIWAYDFMSGHTTDGRSVRILNVVDEYTRELVSCTVERSIGSRRVERVLADLFQRRGQPEILRSDNGREFIATHLTAWLGDQGVECAFIAKGRPNQNSIVERLNRLMRRHVLDAEDLNTLLEARVVLTTWAEEYNHHRPHGALNGTSPSQYRKQYTPKLQTRSGPPQEPDQPPRAGQHRSLRARRARLGG